MRRISRLLESMGEELENYPKYRIVKRAIVDDYALLDMEKDNDIWKRLEGKLMVTRDIHPLYRSFEEEIGREKIKLSRMRVEMDNLRAQAREPLAIEDAEKESRPLKRNTALAAVLSLFMALVLAFVFEFFSSKKENNG